MTTQQTNTTQAAQVTPVCHLGRSCLLMPPNTTVNEWKQSAQTITSIIWALLVSCSMFFMFYWLSFLGSLLLISPTPGLPPTYIVWAPCHLCEPPWHPLLPHHVAPSNPTTTTNDEWGQMMNQGWTTNGRWMVNWRWTINGWQITSGGWMMNQPDTNTNAHSSHHPQLLPMPMAADTTPADANPTPANPNANANTSKCQCQCQQTPTLMNKQCSTSPWQQQQQCSHTSPIPHLTFPIPHLTYLPSPISHISHSQSHTYPIPHHTHSHLTSSIPCLIIFIINIVHYT